MDTNREQKSVGRGAVIAGLALSLMLTGRARAQDNPNAQQPDPVQQQGQDQTPPDPQGQDQPSPPASTKPRPRYAPQDANRPPYVNDREQQGNSPYGAPPPSAQEDQGDYPDQQDDRQAAPPPPYRGRATRPPQSNTSHNAQPTGPLPQSLQIPAGTVLLVHVNEFVSSDKNSVGDRITATLDRPIVVNGWVVARRGQTVTGQVTAAVKAGRVKGTSQLGLELTDLQLVDGNSAPILTEIWKGSGGTTHGGDAATIGGTTALGAAIGAAADWGRGAAIGAGAGAAAGIGAVLLTRGRPTEILPETPLTFRIVDPVTVDTTKSAQAFAPVTQQDYDGGRGYRGGRRYASGNDGYPPPAPYGPYYGYPVYPYYANPYPFVGFYYGPRWHRGWWR
jgi:hypothetical protein